MIQLLTAYDKPNRLESYNKDTDPEYHAKYAKYCLSNSGSGLHADFISKTKTNKDFYKGKQWTQEEDLEAFLKDDTGQERNRIKVVNNVIRPLMEQYRGNVIRLIINASAVSISPKAKNRRDKALAEKLFQTDLAKEVDSMSDYIRKKYNVGKNEEETIQIFENTYVDLYSEKITMLIKYIATINKFEDLQLKAAENLAFSGLVVSEGKERGGHLKWEIIESERFGFDRSARKADLSDAAYMWVWEDAHTSDIYETYQEKLSSEDRKAIENFVSKLTNSTNYEQSSGSGRIPVFRVFWRDVEHVDYGYVNQFGYKVLEKINHIGPNETEPKFTDKDLVDPPNEPRIKKRFKGSKKVKSYVDVVRFCDIIPNDILGSTGSDSKQNDIVLDYGLYYYQDTEWENPSNVNFPFKCATWAYVDGEIMSPFDDAIDPQRLINRIMSVAESQINNSGGTGVIYDKDSVDGQSGEDEIMRAVSQGKPFGIRSKGRGVPNMIGNYDATVKNGTYGMFELISGLKNTVQEMTGVNEALKGESMGQDQLVGVTQMLLQRGSLMQEPFYYAISSLFMQMYQYNSNVGKRIYIDNEYELAIMTGDEGVEVLQLSRDMKDETFRVFIKKENMDDMLVAQADQMLLMLLQFQLIDDKIFANLYGRSTPSEVGRYLRTHAKDRAEMARKQSAIESQKSGQMVQALAQENDRVMNAQKMDKDEDFIRQQMLEKTKNEGKINQILAKGAIDNSGA